MDFHQSFSQDKGVFGVFFFCFLGGGGYISETVGCRKLILGRDIG